MAQITLDQAIHIAFQHHQAGRPAEAEKIYRQVLAQQPEHAEVQANLGAVLQTTGRLEEAVTCYRQAIRLRPGLAEAHCNLGIALAALGRRDEAIASYGQAIALKPDFAEAHCNLGIALHAAGRLDEAVAACRAAVRFKPDLPEAHETLADALRDTGQLDEAMAAYQRTLALKPDRAPARGNLLFLSYYHPASDPATQLGLSREWERHHAKPLESFIRPHANDREANRRLRIGYVSADFRDHAVSRFVLPLLAAHDHEAFEVFGYADVPRPDAVTEKLKACCDGWRSLTGVKDEKAAEMIREDRIDILIDLAGHTRDNRLLIFARKPAPVQVTWLGFPGTTGLSAMDYRFTDALADPPDLTDRFCSERLIRLPRTNWCYQAPDESPAVNELPAIANRCLTFGSFNNFVKVNDSLLRLWARILHATPGARLMLKAGPLECASVQERVRGVMFECGIEPERLELLGWVPSVMHLAQYGRVDIGLDTYPYHGTTTTCEALWMGVPVVTLAGNSHVSRVGVSLLSNVGLPELIADTPERYVRIAGGLAADLPRLGELRRSLRARMQASPLMDGPAFARDVEAAYRTMWRSWCEK